MRKNHFYIFILSIICSISILMGTFFYFIPREKGDMMYNSKKINDIRGKIQLAEAFQNSHDNMAAYEKELNTRKNMIDAKLPNKFVVGAYMEEIERIAHAKGVRLNSIIPQKAVEGKNRVVDHSFTVALTGDYFSLLDFFKGLDDSKLYMQISKLNLVTKGSCANCDLTIKAYTYNKDKEKVS